jgi:LPS export ABC transporter protein LptC
MIHLNKSGLLLILLLLIIAGATTWLRTHPDTGDTTADADANPQIDFFMENFRIRQYTREGRLHYMLKGSELNYIQQGERTEISHPELELDTEDKRWTVQSERAVTTTDGTTEEIRFLGKVRMEQDALLIRTEALLLKPDTDYMETLEPAMISGTGGTIEARSLSSNLQTGMHTLLGVKGRYAP